MRLFSLFLMWRKSDEKISKSTRRHFYGKLLFFKDEEIFDYQPVTFKVFYALDEL